MKEHIYTFETGQGGYEKKPEKAEITHAVKKEEKDLDEKDSEKFGNE